MKLSAYAPKRHLFVCTHTRSLGDPLGTGCSSRGEEVFKALKARVAEKRLFTTWVTRTGCMGVCPKEGATVASTEHETLLNEVTSTDAEELLR
jgi:predicted metal-binding protein